MDKKKKKRMKEDDKSVDKTEQTAIYKPAKRKTKKKKKHKKLKLFLKIMFISILLAMIIGRRNTWGYTI